jgi:hypothetical protein
LTGTGSGPFNNPIITDYLGAVTGNPYTQEFAILTTNYSTVLTTAVSNAIAGLDFAIVNYNNLLAANAAPDTSTINANVAILNSALNAIPVTPALYATDTAYYTMLNRLTTEVANLQKAGAVFGSAPSQVLQGFGQRIGSIASDSIQFNTYQFFANIITNDVNGDTIRAAIAESINISTLQSKGIATTNDPAPATKLYQAHALGIPLTTYLNQNK